MRNIHYFKKWQPIEYGKTQVEGFGDYSNLLRGEGDENAKASEKDFKMGVLNWMAKRLFFKKFILLCPKGDPEAVFRIGFYSEKFNVCEINPEGIARKVSDGPFAMRLGPSDCSFFVVGTEQIELEHGGYIRNDLDLY